MLLLFHQKLFSITINLSFFFLSLQEQKIREGLYMMGLKDEIFHLSWFITYAVQAGFLACNLISKLFFFLHLPLATIKPHVGVQ